MAKREFAVTKLGKDTIKISADDGLIVDDWKDLTSPSCLVFGVGRFRIEDTKTVFFQDGTGDVFIFFGRPFGEDDTGEATLLLVEDGCDMEGWTWARIS
jgi:hypothetical protein